MKISMTIEFTNPEEAAQAMARLQGNAVPASTPQPAAGGQGKGAGAAKGAAAAAPAPSAQAATGAASASPATSGKDAGEVIPYADLQKAAVKLAQINRPLAEKVAKDLGVPNFKAFEPEDKAAGRADALKAVNAALAELGAA